MTDADKKAWEELVENAKHRIKYTAPRDEGAAAILAADLELTRLRGVEHCIKIIDGIHDIGDVIYDVRENEGKGWDGPEVKAYGEAVAALKAYLGGGG